MNITLLAELDPTARVLLSWGRREDQKMTLTPFLFVAEKEKK